MVAAGLALVLHFALAFMRNGYRFGIALLESNHQAISGVFLIGAGVLLFVSMLLMHAVALYVPRDPDAR